MILDVNKLKRVSASHGSWDPFALLPFEHRSIKLLKLMLHTRFVALEKPKSVIRIVFLDFSKAFNHIDHNILLNDFKSVGFRPALLSWLASYLSDRLQRVNIDGSTSCFKKINAGVSHGSKIDPIAFITKINKLPDLALTDKNSSSTFPQAIMHLASIRSQMAY
jgi:hypothetical protein